MEENKRQQWEASRCYGGTQYEMRQKLLLPSAVSVMSYFDSTTWSFFPSQSPHSLPVLSHRATKGAIAPAMERREAES